MPLKVGITRSSLHSGCICSLGYFPFQPVGKKPDVKNEPLLYWLPCLVNTFTGLGMLQHSPYTLLYGHHEFHLKNNTGVFKAQIRTVFNVNAQRIYTKFRPCILYKTLGDCGDKPRHITFMACARVPSKPSHITFWGLVHGFQVSGYPDRFMQLVLCV